ncbi:MAG: hypothetical protein F4138_04475 [Acidimicrobiia bacterium]|nr:hypothetical protein [Acidimicrobiia bacterium]MYC58475.1 hypothetical protein [Acidimicrobiia bacterium]MYG94233.1 hypothetical protein [Acidimicrobiia bacterium]MYI30419.1 hypothetical protein [Acidimicrobiia bacterium]
MPIHRAQDWGEAGGLASSGVLVYNDAAANEVVQKARRANQPLPELGLLGGDLYRTLGGGAQQRNLHSPKAWRFKIDVGAVLLDGRLFWFCSHLLARRGTWSGEVLVAMNAAWLNKLNLGPKAHPGDGLLDISLGNLAVNERLKARRRARTGDHLPHPDISYRRTNAMQVELAQPTPVFLDGISVGQASNISLRVEPATLTIVV